MCSIEEDYVLEGDGVIAEIMCMELYRKLGGSIDDISVTNQRSHEVQS